MFQGISKEKANQGQRLGLPKYGSLNDRTTSSYLFAHDLAYDLAHYLAKVYDPD